MSREIKFRGKRIDSGEWIEGYYFVHLSSTDRCPDIHCIYDGKHIEVMEYHEVHPDTVGQRSGMLVENEVSIDWWEGDLLCKGSVHPNAAIAIITYNRREARWVAGSNSGGTDFCSLEEAYKCGWRKIGTIHKEQQ